MIAGRLGKRQIDNLGFYTKIFFKLILFVIFLAVLFCLFAKVKTYFPIKSVKVYGAKHIDQKEMQDMLTPLVNKGFFAIDVESIKEQLLHSSWVSNVIVQRIWPDQVAITIMEKIPAAYWNNSGLISSNGELFSPKDNCSDKLPHFYGPSGQHIEMLNHYQKLSKVLANLQFKITDFELTPEYDWRLTFDNGIKVRIGYKDILTRMDHFVKVYPKIIGSRVADVEYVDLRYPNGLAVKWKTIT